MGGPNNADLQQPWYRHFYVWMLILLPASVVVASIITVHIAFSNAPQIIPKTPKTIVEQHD